MLFRSICEALGARLSELLRDVSTTVASAEQVDGILAPVSAAPAEDGQLTVSTMVDGEVSVTVRQDTPLKATLRATRTVRAAGRERDVLSAA